MTDPFTALALYSAAVALSIPSRAKIVGSERGPRPDVLVQHNPTLLVPVNRDLPSTMLSAYGASDAPLPPWSRLQFDLLAFAADPIAGSPNASNEALDFAQKLPTEFPIPKAVESSDGVIALFWETEIFYADIEFRGDGKVSAFTRTRFPNKKDEALDNVPLADINERWIYQILGMVLPAAQKIAA